MKKEMMKDVLKNVNPNTKLVHFIPKEWDRIMKKYNCSEKGSNKDLWLESIADYIVDNKIPYPRKKSLMSLDECNDAFIKFYNTDGSQWVKKIEDYDEVLEKYDDYRRPFSKYGICVIDGSSKFNLISDYYTYEERVKCPYFNSSSPMEIWQDRNKLAKLLMYFYRKPSWQDGRNTINKQSWMGALRLGTYQAGNFKPTVVKSIYHITRAKKVLDTSSGWGDRLAGFYGSQKTEEYVGTDPNVSVWRKYQEMCVAYEKLLGCKEPILKVYDDRFVCKGIKRVTIFNNGAERMPWDTFEQNFDCAFTSPPYFSTELYAKGLEGEENQSWKKFNTYEKWRDNFFIPVSENSYRVLGEGGHFLCNILDPTVKTIRYYASDEMIDYMEKKYPGSFIGQIGMKFIRRAGTTRKNEKEVCFVENVWVFRKGEEKFSLVDINTKTSLKDFF